MPFRVVAVLIAIGGSSHVVLACSCGRIASVAEAQRHSSLVFEGTVVSKRIVLGNITLGSEEWVGPLEEYSFAIKRSWKGPSVPEVRLRQGYNSCDNAFAGGETYLVFASPNHEDPATYSSGRCGPTTLIANAGRHVALLGPPVANRVISRRPLRSLSAAYYARLYFWSGAAAQFNVIRHPKRGLAWRLVGRGGLCLAAGALLSALASAVLIARRGRSLLVAALLALTLALAISSVFASGASLLRNDFYSHYGEWKP